MKVFSGFMFLFALSMFANAISNRWAFVPTETGTKWVILDIVIGLLFAALSYFTWAAATRRELLRDMELYEMERLERERIATLSAGQESATRSPADGS